MIMIIVILIILMMDYNEHQHTLGQNSQNNYSQQHSLRPCASLHTGGHPTC